MRLCMVVIKCILALSVLYSTVEWLDTQFGFMSAIPAGFLGLLLIVQYIEEWFDKYDCQDNKG